MTYSEMANENGSLNSKPPRDTKGKIITCKGLYQPTCYISHTNHFIHLNFSSSYSIFIHMGVFLFSSCGGLWSRRTLRGGGNSCSSSTEIRGSSQNPLHLHLPHRSQRMARRGKNSLIYALISLPMIHYNHKISCLSHVFCFVLLCLFFAVVVVIYQRTSLSALTLVS